MLTPEVLVALENWFTHHPPQQGQAETYERIRAAGLYFAKVVVELTPNCPDQTVAVRKIREAVMTANAAVACGGQ